jgi:4-diphosphocytidyl-2C-methyl-D-erythritol kinase
MAYPERQPIYSAYKEIIDKIIDEKEYQQYAESEINELNQSLLRAFQEIAKGHIMLKWPGDK